MCLIFVANSKSCQDAMLAEIRAVGARQDAMLAEIRAMRVGQEGFFTRLQEHVNESCTIQ